MFITQVYITVIWFDGSAILVIRETNLLSTNMEPWFSLKLRSWMREITCVCMWLLMKLKVTVLISPLLSRGWLSTYACICVCVCFCTHVCVCTYVSVYAYLCLCLHLCMHLYTCVDACICMYLYMCIFIIICNYM